MPNKKDKRIAVLIDADNISYRKTAEILNEVNRYGVPTIKRIYGDWTSPYVEKWKSILLTHAITPIQQYSYTQGKNSTDSALIIDAMDILHLDKIDGFCIVSSDSDFTRLATRIRESGKLVIGVGERKTPKPFIASCDKFIYLEILEKLTPEDEEEDEVFTALKGKFGSVKKVPNNGKAQVSPYDKPVELDFDTLNMLKDAVDDTADDVGWAFLADVGNLLLKRMPDFDSRNYGYKKLSILFKAFREDFDIDEKSMKNSDATNIYIRNIIKKNPLRVIQSDVERKVTELATAEEESTIEETLMNAELKTEDNLDENGAEG